MQMLCNAPPNGETIVITTHPTPPPSTIIPRSVVPTIEAYINYDTDLVHVVFNAPIGTATITITDTNGQTVSSCTVDSSMLASAYLDAPTVGGTYTLTITTAGYQGEGEFTI